MLVVLSIFVKKGRRTSVVMNSVPEVFSAAADYMLIS